MCQSLHNLKVAATMPDPDGSRRLQPAGFTHPEGCGYPLLLNPQAYVGYGLQTYLTRSFGGNGFILNGFTVNGRGVRYQRRIFVLGLG